MKTNYETNRIFTKLLILTVVLVFVPHVFFLIGMYPTDPEEQLLCDEIFEVMQEMASKVPQHPDAEEKKKLREAFVETTLPKYMNFLVSKSKVWTSNSSI